MEKCDIAIIGAGPYGLAAAAHLRQANGLDIRLIGEPMSFWKSMPEEMLLRSPWAGSHIAHPDGALTLDAYKAANGNSGLKEPLPLHNFVEYGHWFHSRAGLAADRRKIERIDLEPGGYRLTFDSGDRLSARRVVVAAGIQGFACRPTVFDGLPPQLVTHTAQHRKFAQFRGQDVVVVGGGQSATEAAAFLFEAGARVEVLLRQPGIHWLGRQQWMRAKGIGWMFYGAGGIGPPGISQVIQHPNLFRRLPQAIQEKWSARAMRPAAAPWLKPRTRNIPIRTERFVVHAKTEGSRVRIRMNDGAERVVDHVILGTGYRVDIGRYPFLTAEVLERIKRVNGHPLLDLGFESSCPGLHFLGAPAAYSFGPLLRFVAGTEFASRALTGRILEAHKCRAAFEQTPLVQAL